MVREISGLNIDSEDSEDREPDRPDFPDTRFEHESVQNKDLAEPFARFASTRKGSFKRLLTIWVANRLKADRPVDFDDPDSRTVSPSLRKALQAAFNRARQKRTK